MNTFLKRRVIIGTLGLMLSAVIWWALLSYCDYIKTPVIYYSLLIIATAASIGSLFYILKGWYGLILGVSVVLMVTIITIINIVFSRTIVIIFILTAVLVWALWPLANNFKIIRNIKSLRSYGNSKGEQYEN